MKFTALSKLGKEGKPTSFHAIFGCREAREMYLSDENGREREIIFLPISGGVLLAPVLRKTRVLEYNGFRTEVCTNDKLFFGKLLNISQNITWRSPDESKAEASFHAAVDRFLASEQ